MTPPEYAYAIVDLFETITLYENRATRAVAKKRADGKLDLEITVLAKKLRASELGDETEVPVHDFVDIGAVDASGKVVVKERKKLDENEATFTLVVDALPAKAWIDPMGKLIDRYPDDNLVAVVAE